MREVFSFYFEDKEPLKGVKSILALLGKALPPLPTKNQKVLSSYLFEKKAT